MEGARPIEPVLLPATKFHPPARREDALLRGRLVEALKGRLPKARLTLFSAPAGAGKTTLLAELPRVFPEMKWAWLLLDPEDNDPSRFAAALAASLTLANLPAGTAATDAVAAIVNQAARRAGDAIALAMDRGWRRRGRWPRPWTRPDACPEAAGARASILARGGRFRPPRPEWLRTHRSRTPSDISPMPGHGADEYRVNYGPPSTESGETRRAGDRRRFRGADSRTRV